jgi:hypothetical protein
MIQELELKNRVKSGVAYEVMRIPPEILAEWWPKFERELDRVPHIWEEQWTKTALREAVMSDWVQVWGFGPPEQTRVVVFTQVVDFPVGKVLQIFLGFGNSLDAALPVMEAAFERLAIVSGCKFCEIIGRPGWERKLPRFRRVAVVLRCKVELKGVH